MHSITPNTGDLDTLDFTIEHGQIVPVYRMNPKATPQGVGFVDQLSFTFLNDFDRNEPLRREICRAGGFADVFPTEVVKIEDPRPNAQADRRSPVETLLRKVFGLRVGAKRPVGLNFYKDTWALEDNAGMVSIGGQGDTILVQLTGHGMALARDGWEQRLQAWSKVLTRFVITRLDLAYDDHDGTEYSVDRCLGDYVSGAFKMGGRPPKAEQRGNWIVPDGAGRTFYVGNRANGKLLRVYEKGRQLGDPDSEWVRVELELHNKDRVIPFDAILNPGAYLAGAYTALNWVAKGKPHNKIATVQKIAKMTYEAFLGHLKRSYGGLLGVILQVEESALGRLAALAEALPTPKRLDLALSALTTA